MLHEEHYEATVPTVRDRVVQAAVKLVIEPVFEADFLGLVSLDRLVVTPSPFRDWRAKPNAAGKGRR